MIRPLLCLLALHTSTLAAQQPSLVGSWQLSYPAGATIENGVATTIFGKGVLTVVRQADSLIGTLVMDANPDLPARPPVRMAAPAGAADAATFLSHSEATISMNGDEQKANVTSTWKLAVKGDSLVGTVERTLEGYEEANQPAKPVTGTRRKS